MKKILVMSMFMSILLTSFSVYGENSEISDISPRIEASYTVTLPDSIDIGALTKDGQAVIVPFDVSAVGTLNAGDTLKVTAANGALSNGKSESIAYTINTDNLTFDSTLTATSTVKTGSIEISKDTMNNIKYAGEYIGVAEFTVNYTSA